MAVFRSRYAELIFYVDGKPRRFSNGVYTTEDKQEIAVLEKLSDVERVDEPSEETKKKASK